MKLLENKVVIITGAARGIGEAIAMKMAEHGAHVAFTFVSDSSTEKARTIEEKIGINFSYNVLKFYPATKMYNTEKNKECPWSN